METETLDWDDLRYLLAIHRRRTLTAAAKHLGVSQPTMSRRLGRLEARLGARLFRRTAEGHQPTGATKALLAHAERMEAEAQAATRTIGAQDRGLLGEARVTTTQSLASYVVAPLLQGFRRAHPGIVVDLLCLSRRLSLARHEADLALRLAPFDHQDVVQRRVATIGFGLYASPKYLKARGRPDFGRGAIGHDLVLLSEEEEQISDVRWFEGVASQARWVARSNSRAVQHRLCLDGLGIACLPRYLADAGPGLVRIEPSLTPAPRALWLGMHRASRRLPRIAALVRYLGDRLVAMSDVLSGKD